MSDLHKVLNNRSDFRWQLLTTVSAAALIASACGALPAKAESGTSQSPVWIELGGQFAGEEDGQEAFLPPFLLTTPRPPFETASPSEVEKGPISSWDGTAKIAFEPAGTGWVFSAKILYGKSNHSSSVDQQTAQANAGAAYDAYQHITAKSSESHTILDFQAGKDIGLGMFGRDGSSVASLGVRFAQFNSLSNAGVQSQPTNVGITAASYHRFYASFDAKRKFTGVGPSLSWDASADLIGNPSAGNISFDWGVNGAVLFGRQRTQILHQTSNIQHVYHTSHSTFVHIPVYRNSTTPARSKQVTVPNVGGFAGISWRYPNAKVSVGYRADFFFGAMDGGIDTAHRENVGFYGPFATVSVGIGG